jgi:uncharacterized protein
MPSLSDKLKSLGVQVGASSIQPPPPKRASSLEQVLPGRIQPTARGEAYIIEQFYSPDYHHGHTELEIKGSLETIAHWASAGDPDLSDRLQHCTSRSFAFLDIETTGLMGGAGVYAFLVGIGRFTEAGFHLAQFFMRDPAEEAAQLLAIEEFLSPCETLVTYNGKSFDGPILNSRYSGNGWNSPLKTLIHLDLLPLARRLWRERLPSRTLGNVETNILGARRSQEDVPGWAIPQMYFDYLRSGDPLPLKGVVYHNAVDVLSMAALLNHVSIMLENPFDAQHENILDLLGIGRIYEGLGRIDEACLAYRRCLEQGLPQDQLWDTVQRLSFLYKRAGSYPSALPLWELAAQNKHIYAHIELAKYYEHQARNIPQAQYWTEAALEHVHAPGFPPYTRREWLRELEHRKDRLQRKLLKQALTEDQPDIENVETEE